MKRAISPMHHLAGGGVGKFARLEKERDIPDVM